MWEDIVRMNEKRETRTKKGRKGGAHRSGVGEHHEQPKVVIVVRHHLEVDHVPRPRGRVPLGRRSRSNSEHANDTGSAALFIS
jgi:hypothetical protein